MSVVAAVPASTVVLLRPGYPFEVFLVRRSDSIAFMGGAHVFPGGRVDAADYIDHLETTIDGMTAAAARMPDVPPEAAVAHHVAALRELFEEAGVLLARPLTATSVERLAAVSTRPARRERSRSGRSSAPNAFAWRSTSCVFRPLGDA